MLSKRDGSKYKNTNCQILYNLTFLKAIFLEKWKGKEVLAGFSLGKNDLNFWNPMFFNNVWSARDMECGRDLRKVDICVSVVEPETETETEPDPEPEPERNRNRNRNRKRNRKRNRNRNHNFFGGISPPHRRGEQKRFFLLKMTIISFFLWSWLSNWAGCHENICREFSKKPNFFKKQN